MSIVQRLQKYMDFKGLNPNKITVDAGLSVGLIGKAIKKDSGLNSDTIEKILHAYSDMNPEWFLMDKGGMLRRDEVETKNIENSNVLYVTENVTKNDTKPNLRKIVTNEEEKDEEDSGITIHNINRRTRDALLEAQEIPLYSLEATAGLLELFKGGSPSHLLNIIKIPGIPRCDGAIFVTGDSMYPLLKSGDIVLYKQVPVETASIFFGEMYLLGIRIDDFEEMVTVKYVQKSEKGEEYIRLVSQNQHHSPKDIRLATVSAMALVKVSIRVNTMM